MEEELISGGSGELILLHVCSDVSSGAESGEDTDLGLTAKVRKGHRYVSHMAVDMD